VEVRIAVHDGGGDDREGGERQSQDGVDSLVETVYGRIDPFLAGPIVVAGRYETTLGHALGLYPHRHPTGEQPDGESGNDEAPEWRFGERGDTPHGSTFYAGNSSADDCPIAHSREVKNAGRSNHTERSMDTNGPGAEKDYRQFRDHVSGLA
jgi:hypothetical protein